VSEGEEFVSREKFAGIFLIGEHVFGIGFADRHGVENMECRQPVDCPEQVIFQCIGEAELANITLNTGFESR
jgi:hypothetical protein